MHRMNKPIQAWCAWKCVSSVSEEASVEDAKSTNIWVKQGWATGSIESAAVRKQNPWALISEYAGGNFVSILTWMISSLSTERVIRPTRTSMNVWRIHKGVNLHLVPFQPYSFYYSLSSMDGKKSEQILCNLVAFVPCILFIFRKTNTSTVIPPVFSGGFSGKESVCQYRRCKRLWFDPWFGKIPWRRACQLTPVFLPGESHGHRSLAGYSPWGHKELDPTEWLSTRCDSSIIVI